MRRLPIQRSVSFVLIGPHYPENLGAAARAIKTMGFSRLGLVSPSRLAVPEHEMAQKMAVKAWDVLDETQVYDNIDEALVGSDWVVATSSRRGISGVLTLRTAAIQAVERAQKNQRISILFGNEKTGLTKAELARADRALRIPMAQAQPSINLAQAVQLVAYELFVAQLEAR